MGELIETALLSESYGELAVGVSVGFAGAVFLALMWLRVFRWTFALLGIRA